MMVRSIAALAGVLTLPAPAAAQVWTAMARDEGVAVPCRTAADRATYERLLDQAGWSMSGRRRPAIDFATGFAVIVAPGRFRPNADLKLVERRVAGGRRIVRWRFVERVELAERKEDSMTFGSSGPPGKEILVVAFPRSVLGLPQSCLGAY